jgi:ribosomal protein S18 acetylase RimI-like enzyme
VCGVSHISPLDVGARVSVRRRVGGDQSDVVGDLLSVDDDVLAIRVASGDLVPVPHADVVAARVVGPGPRSAIELEGVSARGWPAPDTEWLGRWWLRAAGGFTARANSVRPLGSPGVDVDEAVTRVAGWYGERALPPKIQVVVGSSLDRDLARRGWVAGYEVADLTATVARVCAGLAERASGQPDGPDVEVREGSASSAWLGLFRGGSNPASARAILEGPPLVAFATIADGGEAVAIGRAAVEPPWVGLTAIEVAPHARRRGHARAVMGALLSWARDRGALRVYLEVLSTNTPALTLYESLGFAEHHRYACRELPVRPS